jgi:glycine C-acetyltransferase
VAASLKAIELVSEAKELREKLAANTKYFREAMTEKGFDIRPGSHPIVPIMLGDAALAKRFADALLKKGVYAVGFSYPVVPQGQARIRVQVSAAHSRDDLAFAVERFAEVRRDLLG